MAQGGGQAPRVKASSGQASAADRRALFVEAYIANGGNATQAAIAAGFSPKSAGQQGSELLKHPNVTANIAERRNELREASRLTTENVARELAKLVFADPRKFIDEAGNIKPLHELDDDSAGALASLEVFEEFEGHGKDREQIGVTKKIKLWDKNAAIEKAMKHLGMFETDNRQKTPIIFMDAEDWKA